MKNPSKKWLSRPKSLSTAAARTDFTASQSSKPASQLALITWMSAENPKYVHNMHTMTQLKSFKSELTFFQSRSQYMERMQLEYNKAAQEAGIYIVSACGFDSIPSDLGLIFTQDKFGGEVNSVETYLNFWSTSNVPGTGGLHYGTWESAVYGLAHANELRALRTKLYPEKLPELKPRLKSKWGIYWLLVRFFFFKLFFIFFLCIILNALLCYRGMLHHSAISEGWSTVFPGSDRSVCLRTQRFLYQKYKQRPAQVQTYMTFK